MSSAFHLVEEDVLRCVKTWIEVRPVLAQWLHSVVETTSDGQSFVITLKVPTHFQNTKGENIYFSQREQVPFELWPKRMEELPRFISYLMGNLVYQLVTSTGQPPVNLLYLMPQEKEGGLL